MEMTEKLLKKASGFGFVVLVSFFIMRIYALGIFYVLEKYIGRDSQIAKQIVEDPWHHYQIGFLLIIIGIVFYRTRKSIILIAIGLGIFFEE